jgi:hypothetical protein
METINVKVSGEKTEVKLFKKFKVLDFNLAIVDFPHRDGSCKTVVEFSSGMKIGFLRSHKNTIKDIVEKSSLYFMELINECGEEKIIKDINCHELINN